MAPNFRCKFADGEKRCSPQQDQIPSHGQGDERGSYTVTFIPATLSRNAGKIVLLDLKYTFLKVRGLFKYECK